MPWISKLLLERYDEAMFVRMKMFLAHDKVPEFSAICIEYDPYACVFLWIRSS